MWHSRVRRFQHRAGTHGSVVGVGALVAVLISGGVAAAEDLTIDDLPTLSAGELQRSVQPFDPRDRIKDIDLQARVVDVDLGRQVQDIEQQFDTFSPGSGTLQLNTDVLFAFGSAALAPAAATRIEQFATSLPKGVTVAVGGHTDAIGGEAANLTLSTKRAKAVAEVIGEARPDLTVSAKGFGETKPVAPNTSGGKDNPEGRSKNRRVEIAVTTG